MKKLLAKIGITDKASRNRFLLQIAGFALVGVTNVAVHYGVYYLFLRMGMHYVWANAIGFFVALVNSFVWNKLLVFRSHRKGREPSDRAATSLVYEGAGQFVRMVLTKAGYLAMDTGLLALFVQVLGVSEELAPLLCILILNPYSFLMTKLWVFKDGSDKTVKTEEPAEL